MFHDDERPCGLIEMSPLGMVSRDKDKRPQFSLNDACTWQCDPNRLPIRFRVGAFAAELSADRLAFSETLSQDYPHGQQVRQPAAATH
jgi:hypothetical protein